MPGYRVLRIDEVERHTYPTGADWFPLRKALGVGAFGLNAWRADAGTEVIERHDETNYDHQEVYVVIAGRARFTVGGEEIDAPAATVVFIEDPALERVAVAEEAGTLVLAVGAKRGEAFEVSAWEGRRLGNTSRSDAPSTPLHRRTGE
jgi:hypothetical protein